MFSKKILLSIKCLFFVFLTASSFSQQIKIPEKILEFQRNLENYSSQSNMRQNVKNMNMDQLKHLAKMMYEAYEKDAITTNELLLKRDKKIDSLNSVNKEQKVMPSQIKWKLLKRFKKEFSPDIYALLAVPYLLKIRIESVTKFIYKDPGSLAQVPRTNIECVVLDILKGDSNFMLGDSLNFYYMNFWRSTTLDFKEEEVCFIPLTPAREYGEDYKLIALVTTLDQKNKNNSSYGIFPIKNDNLIDKNNFWKYGNIIIWDKFKSNLLKKINLIKSW